MENFIGLPVGHVEVVRRWRRETRCVPLARAELRKALAAWGLSELEGDALLVASELLTNAVRHATTPRDREIETRYVRRSDGVPRPDAGRAASADPPPPHRPETATAPAPR